MTHVVGMMRSDRFAKLLRMDTTAEREPSKPGSVFEKNIRRLTLLIQAPMPQAEAISAKLSAATKDGSFTPDPSIVQPILDEMSKSLQTRMTIMTWAVPMLVTFTEAYLQDAFALMISGACGRTALPGPIVDEISAKWIKNTIRSGNPHQWVNQLKKFGVTGYPDDLASNLQKTWDLRHDIIHSAEPDTTVMKDFPLSESLKTVSILVQTTDAFVAAQAINHG